MLRLVRGSWSPLVLGVVSDPASCLPGSSLVLDLASDPCFAEPPLFVDRQTVPDGVVMVTKN